MDTDLPLIVGAGPVGLGAALFLARRGIATRVVEMRQAPSVESRALAVNPRTLSILESTGVTDEMLRRGLPVHGVRFRRRGKVIGQLDFDRIHPRYPFMLALSQATTERLLERALNDIGGHVERGRRLVDCRAVGDGSVEASLQSAPDGMKAEVIRCPWLLAADGAHSVARDRMGVDFPGASLTEPWYLVDVALRTKLPQDQAHVFFLSGGAFVFMIRVVDDQRPGGEASGKEATPLWRIMTNRPNPVAVLAYAEGEGGVLPKDRSIIAALPVWESKFHISHRVDARLEVGGVFFAGDAAHIHSPLGARGMNLGLEDVFVFSQLLAAGRLHDYDGLRRPVQKSVVPRVDLLSRIASAESAIYPFVRRFIFPNAMAIDPIRAVMLRTVTGLDHDLADIPMPRHVTMTRPRLPVASLSKASPG